MPRKRKDAETEQSSLPQTTGTAPPGGHIYVGRLASEESSLGKRKRQQGHLQHPAVGMDAPPDSGHRLRSNDSTQAGSPSFQTELALQIPQRRQQQPWTPMSPHSIGTHHDNITTSGQERRGPRVDLQINRHGSAEVNNTASHINPPGCEELSPYLQERNGTPTFVLQLREHANERISPAAVFPSPAASDDGASGLANDAEKWRWLPNTTVSNLTSSIPQVVNIPTPSPLSLQQPPLQRRPPPTCTPPQARQVSSQASPPVPDVYKAENCLRKIDEFVNEIGKEVLPGSVITSRIDLLRGASRRGDLMYLTLHQIMCIQTIAPDQVPYGIQSIPNLKDELACLDMLLSRNDRLPKRFIEWAAKFPTEFAHVAVHWCYGTASLVEQCKNFLTSLSTNYAKLRKGCEARRGPPSVRELVRALAIPSSILQNIVFLSILRNLWGSFASTWIVKAEQAFQQEQANHLQRPWRTGPEVDEEERSFANRIQQYYQSHLQTIQAQQRGQRPSSTVGAQMDSHRRQSAPGYLSASSVPQSTPPPHLFQNQWQLPPARAIPGPHSTGSHVFHSALPAQQNPAYGPINPPPPPAGVPTYHHPVPRAQNPPQPAAPYGQLQPQPMWPSQTLPSQQISSAGPPQQRPFLPLLGEIRPQAAHVAPSVYALHQIHLRTPVPKRANRPEMQELGRFYQFVTDMTHRQVLSPSQITEEGAFEVSEDMFKSLPPINPEQFLELPSRTLSEASHVYRFRCVKLAKPEDVSDDGLLATVDTVWPEHAYFVVNGDTLEPRRRKQWGKDLSIDITHLIKAGPNSLRVYWNYDLSYKHPLNYAAVVEIASVQSHRAVKQQCVKSQIIPRESILDNIKLSLSTANSSNGTGDDEVAIVDNTVTINLFDPYIGNRICAIPVRGKSCLHRDCFDLEIYLHSRPVPRDAPTFSTIDEWRCPICKADARPPSLIVDGFLADVRMKLESRGSLNTRAIVVEKDGSWKPKEENRPDHRRRSSVNTKPQVVQATEQQKGKAEIIDLLDDDE